ncbi:MAG: hypothetical protein V9H25_03810 [Candidatus Competibacter sp.]
MATIETGKSILDDQIGTVLVAKAFKGLAFGMGFGAFLLKPLSLRRSNMLFPTSAILNDIPDRNARHDVISSKFAYRLGLNRSDRAGSVERSS